MSRFQFVASHACVNRLIVNGQFPSFFFGFFGGYSELGAWYVRPLPTWLEYSTLEHFEQAKVGLKPSWHGTEAEQYAALFSRFQAAATSVRNVIADVHNAMADAGMVNEKMKSRMRQNIDA